MNHPIASIFIILSALNIGLQGATIQDTESASHGDNAAQYQITDTYSYPGFQLIQINLPVLSHYSYIVVSDGQALVVDPGRDIQFYLDTLKQQNLKVMGLFLSHSHADFVAGHSELVQATGCPVYQSAKSKASYPIKEVTDDMAIQVGQAKVVFIDTPGHVVDGTSALVYSPGQNNPAVMLSGDYLFVGSVGRPDLVMGTTSSALAGLSFDTWHNKVGKLPDSTRVFPAHGAGSLCGAHLRDAPFTTIGEERATNPYLQHTARAEFITAVLGDLSEPPQYFGHNAAMNREGPPLVDWQAALPQAVAPSLDLTDATQTWVIDTRLAQDFAAGHIPNSVNIALRGRFETWTGIMVPWGSHVVLCGEEADHQEAIHRLHRIGYSGERVAFSEWQKSGLAVTKNTLMSPQQLYSAMQSGTEPIIVDVRLPNEWMGLRIGTVLNLPLNKLADLSAKLSPTDPVVAVCNSAYRSTMAIGILERKGFTQVTSLAGGSEAWINAGYPVYGAQTQTSVAATPRVVVPLPERICASELKRLMMDLPGTYDLVDIRPAVMFADYRLPGSVNVTVADLINNPAYLTGAGPLIVVDRDGSLSMAVAGILSQKTKRVIKALYEGLDAYWGMDQIPASGSEMSPTNTVTPTPVPTLPSAPMTPAPVQQPQVPTKKSAGC